MEKILKEIIDEQGVDYLEREPYQVYQRLLKKEVDPGYARIILITLLAGTAKNAQKTDEESLSKSIQKTCFLRKKPADEIAAMYKRLFDTDNLSSWKEKENSGFAEFCETIWTFKWEGEATWSPGGVHIDCEADVTAEVEVEDEKLAMKTVSGILKRNPFTKAEDLFDYFSKQMESALDGEIEEYVTSDDYYPPVMEDFHGNAEYELEACCKRLGLKIVSFECNGDMSDYIPDHDRWR